MGYTRRYGMRGATRLRGTSEFRIGIIFSLRRGRDILMMGLMGRVIRKKVILRRGLMRMLMRRRSILIIWILTSNDAGNMIGRYL
jgi:hypothetical protein